MNPSNVIYALWATAGCVLESGGLLLALAGTVAVDLWLQRASGASPNPTPARKPAKRATGYWQREGWFYVAHLAWSAGNSRGTVTRRLDCVSYHAILWLHGEAKLNEMAIKAPKIAQDWRLR